MNTNTPFTHMQHAVDIVLSSPHETNKVAATIAGTDTRGEPYHISRTNFWPPCLLEKFVPDEKIGNASPTVHAETACILAAPRTQDASIFVTDPPCPNCMKNIAEAGIREIYIDSKGHAKDFITRRGAEFENMSMRIADAAGIKVYTIWRKEQKIEALASPHQHPQPKEKPEIQLNKLTTPPSEQLFKQCIKDIKNAAPVALAIAQNPDQQFFTLCTGPHITIGYEGSEFEEQNEKYSYIMQPLNRLMINAHRLGLEILPDYIYTNQTPTARELVNFIGAGYTKIYIANKQKARDQYALQASAQLKKANLLFIDI